MELIHYAEEEGIATITMCRPEKRNALSFELIDALKKSFQKAGEQEHIKVIVLKAEGDVFCSGADLGHLQQLQHYTFEENVADSNHLKELFLLIYTIPKVVIAEVQGHALAGGCGIVNVCDFSFVVPTAKLGYTEVRIGFVPAIVMVFLIRKIGDANARRLVLSGDLIDAIEAQRLGVISSVVEADELSSTVTSFAQKLIRQNSAQAMGITKQMLAKIPSMSIDQALEYAAQQNALARGTPDCKKGISAFLQKQPLDWKAL
jgi:methylglutaconyl-CoA hydratase